MFAKLTITELLSLMVGVMKIISTTCSREINCTEKCSRQQILNYLLNRDTYDPKISPDYENNNPTDVIVQLFIMSLDSLDEVTMDYTINVFLRQRWVDARLSYTPIPNVTWLELDQKMIDKIWVPDTFFSNEKNAKLHDVTIPNRMMHLYSDGSVQYSLRLSLTLSCYMYLTAFPLDMQLCPISIESYSYTSDNIKFYWDKTRPILIPNRTLPQYTMSTPPEIVHFCSKQYNAGQSFSCLEAWLKLERNAGFYISQIFIPSILIVILSWVSFWVDAEAIPARISLGVLTVLTITTQSSGVRASLPRVSYVKAIDVWMATCLAFVFASLLEFAYINVLTRKRRSRLLSGLSLTEQGALQVKASSELTREDAPGNYVIIFSKKAKMIDKISRVLFPSAFIIFNIIFWGYYMSVRNDHIDHHGHQEHT